MLDAKIALTHDGIFHADDVFAAAIVKSDLPSIGKVKIVRSRHPDDIVAADLVWDVGMVYDHEAKRYDHHMNDAPLREDGTPYSSAGLVFRHYGKEYISEYLCSYMRNYRGEDRAPDDIVDFIFDELNNHLILHLDQVDNGLKKVGGTDIATIIADFNSFHNGFDFATTMASNILSSKILRSAEIFNGRQYVLEECEKLHKGHILVLTKSVPYQRIVFDGNFTDVLYSVFPSENGEWRIGTMPKEPGSMEMRAPLPVEWAGLEREELRKVCGIPTAVFAHKNLFIGGAVLFGDAISMAELALQKHLGEP